MITFFLKKFLRDFDLWGSSPGLSLSRTHARIAHLHTHVSGQVGDQSVTMVAREIQHRYTVYGK